MYPRDIRVNNPTEALVVEQALAMVREMQQTAKAAPDGQVLSRVEQVALATGRELTRKSLEAVLNQQAEEVEKKGRRAGGVPAADRGSTGDAGSGRC
jgi:vancomycin resistance protein YoaR